MDEGNSANMCRVCLSESEILQSIYDPVQEANFPIHLSKMIMSFAEVQVAPGDELPENVCLTCAQTTVNFYLFKLKCEESDRFLRARLNNSLNNADEVVTVEIEQPEEAIHYELDLENDESKCTEMFNIIIKPDIVCEESPESGKQEDGETEEPKLENVAEERQDMEYFPSGFIGCPLCSQIFTSEEFLGHHLKSHSKAFECDTCHKKFSRNDLLTRHKIAHAIKLNGLEFVDSENEDSEKEGNMVMKTEEGLYPCKKCNLLLAKQDVEKHLKKHKNTCPVCHKQFLQQSHLRGHIKVHTTKKQYVCTTCNKVFLKAEQLTSHRNNIHYGIKPHVCDICFKGFNQISNLKDHMRTHNGEKPFLCATCGKGFNQLGNLRQHTIRHSGVKAHLCSTCGHGFASKGELSAHLRKHTGARPFVCSVCKHGFTTSSSLTKHKRIHSGEKPYECDTCNMKFSRSGILARHKRTHTGIKPYVCKFCSKAFTQSNDLTSHLRIHTGEKPYICDVCGQAFRQSSALKTHKKTHVDRNIESGGSGSKSKKTARIVKVKTEMGGMIHSVLLGALSDPPPINL